MILNTEDIDVGVADSIRGTYTASPVGKLF